MTERKPGESRAEHRLRAKGAYDKTTEERKAMDLDKPSNPDRVPGEPRQDPE